MSNHIMTVEKYYAARASEYESTARYTRPENATLAAALKARYQLALEGHDVLELASGPGYWTEAVALTAHSILATDRDPFLVSMVRTRLSEATNVQCTVADAYRLEDLGGPFSAAFANFWWSHIPRKRLSSFLTQFHRILAPRALVMFMDDLPYYHRSTRHLNDDGDLLEERTLQNGETFEIIKNFPTSLEILTILSEHADDVVYKQFAADGYWTVRYRTRPTPDHPGATMEYST